MKEMVTIEAVIERAADGTFDVYCKNEIFTGAGETLEQAKADLLNQMSFYRQTALEQGFKYPAFLDGDYVISYTVDMPSLMKYYVEAGILSLAGLERMTGINQKQLWSYLNGTRPRKEQISRIETGFRTFENDLHTILFA